MQLPETFLLQMREIVGDELPRFIEALSGESSVSIRLNPSKCKDYTLFSHVGEKVLWASHAFYLDSRPVFTQDPLLHAGVYYVQEASSMYLEQIIKKHISSPVKVLDLCAAPGGKSTQISSLLPVESLLVSNEVIRSRANVLSENLIKWGSPNTWVTNNDPAIIGKLSDYFDIILADVPCSGEGMFRKDPAAISEWSPNNVKLCADRQKRIIADVWPSLKPGGILIYSTCTYNKKENEDNIDWICKQLHAEIVDDPRHFFPHKTKGEGFFITGVKKSENQEVVNTKPFKTREKYNNSRNTLQVPQVMKSWIVKPENFTLLLQDQSVVAIPGVHVENYHLLKRELRIINAGIKLGELKGKDVIPAHELAMSDYLSEPAFPRLELNRENALKYLRKDVMELSVFSELPKGYILVTYQGHPLGFIKNIGNRINNLYPNEWRIRMKINL